MERKAVAFQSDKVSSTVFNAQVTTNLSAIPDEDILDTEFTDTITGLESGKTYYVRVAAKTNNSNNKYNYSEIIQITVP